MKKFLVFAVMVLAIASLASSQTKRSNIEQMIMQMEREWADAYIKRDATTLDRILAADFMDADDNGNVQNKAQYIELAKNPVGTFYSAEFSDAKVRAYGDTAVSTSRLVIKGSNREQGEAFRHTGVYVKRQGRWQAVASHISRIAKQ